MNRQLTINLKKRAFTLGFTMVGVVRAVPGRRLDAYEGWLAKNYHGEMAYLARSDRQARRRDLNVILPGVRSIICVALDYFTPQPPPEILDDPGRGRISNYAWHTDYHQVMTPRLSDLADWLRVQAGADVASKVYVDTGAILERDHAETAGLGFTGKNTMLIHPRRGSWCFLGEILTTVALQPEVIDNRMPSCGSCTRCLKACPTGAFPSPYVLDARRCISYLTIELKGWIPRELRTLMGNWVYGCDVCQDVCPFNRFAQQSDEIAFYPAGWDAVAPPLVDLLTLDEAAFSARYTNSPIGRIKRRGLVRNACVAAGNWGNQEAVPALSRLLSDREPIIRGHAAWALGQIGGAKAKSALSKALEVEEDERVREEIRENTS